MKPTELAKEIDIEFEAITSTLDELRSLRHDLQLREATTRDLAAVGLFLANFYNGVENVLKRICRHGSVSLPAGADSHVQLVTLFGDPPREGLPSLLDSGLAEELAPYRQFRHVVHHGYGFQLRWPDMEQGVEAADDVFAKFKLVVEGYVRKIQAGPLDSR